jgi:hypothetical protein
MTWKFLENTMKKTITVNDRVEKFQDECEESKVIDDIGVKEKPQIVHVNIVKIECFKCFFPKRKRLYTYDED